MVTGHLCLDVEFFLSRHPSGFCCLQPFPLAPLAGLDLTHARGVPSASLNISMWVSSAVSWEQGTSPRFLFNWYTWWYKAMISSCVDLCVNSSTAGTSTWGSLSSNGCHWPQWIPWSYSFCPETSIWANILWKRKRWWGLPGSHLGISSKNTLASSPLSASLTDMFFLPPIS